MVYVFCMQRFLFFPAIVSHDLEESTCQATNLDIALVDGDSATCLTVRNNLHLVNVTSNSTTQQSSSSAPPAPHVFLTVITQGMDCSLPFHVRVTHKSVMKPQQCKPSNACELYNNRKQDGGVTSCRFMCSNTGEWGVRLAHVFQGEICDIILEP